MIISFSVGVFLLITQNYSLNSNSLKEKIMINFYQTLSHINGLSCLTYPLLPPTVKGDASIYQCPIKNVATDSKLEKMLMFPLNDYQIKSARRNNYCLGRMLTFPFS